MIDLICADFGASLLIISAVAGAATSGYGVYTQQQGTKAANKAQKQAVLASKKQEQIRKKQVNAQHRQEQIKQFREMAINNAMAVNAAAAGGSLESSGLAGAIAGNTANAETVAGFSNTNKLLSNQMFAANAAESQALGMVNQGQSQVQLGQGYQQFGNSLMSGAQTIANIGTGIRGSLTKS